LNTVGGLGEAGLRGYFLGVPQFDLSARCHTELVF
jgi:hypothetical protein